MDRLKSIFDNIEIYVGNIAEFSEYATLETTCYENILASGELIGLDSMWQRYLGEAYDLIRTHNHKVLHGAEGLDEFYKSIQSRNMEKIIDKVKDLDVLFFRRLEMIKNF